MEVIYRLADDLSAIKGMQEASLRSEGSLGIGLSQSLGLICSAEWWKNIQTGTLQTHTARGVIRGLWFGQYHGGPAEFQMQLPDGTLFGGHCYLDPVDADKVFTLGRIAEVDYVLQPRNVNSHGVATTLAIWLELRVGETSPDAVSPLPHTENNFGRFTRRDVSRSAVSLQLETKKPWWAFWK